MAIIRGGISAYLANSLLNQVLNGVVYTPPTTLYFGINTNFVGPIKAPAEPATAVASATFTDLVVDGTDNTLVSSASRPFVTGDVQVVVTDGAGWTAKTYTIASISGGKAKLTASPAAVGKTGGSYNAVTTTGYARVAKTVAPGLFGVPASGSAANLTVITFPTPILDWCPATRPAKGYFIADAATGGNVLWSADNNAGPKTIFQGDSALSIAIGAATLQLT